MDKLQALEEKLEKTKQLFAKLEHLKHASSPSSSPSPSTLAVVVPDVGKRSKIDTSTCSGSPSGSHDSKQEGGGDDDDSLVVATPFTPPNEEWRSLHCQLVASINPFLRSLTRMTKRCRTSSRTSRKNFDKRSNEQEEQKLAWFANLSPEERVVAIATDDTRCVNIYLLGGGLVLLFLLRFVFSSKHLLIFVV